jgi:CheY-like chemotaxis protein
MDRNSSVLIVTDGSDTWRVLLEILSERFEYRVLTARADQEAMALVDKAHVDLALVEDTRGEQMAEVCDQARTAARTDLPILIQTAEYARSTSAAP